MSATKQYKHLGHTFDVSYSVANELLTVTLRGLGVLVFADEGMYTASINERDSGIADSIDGYPHADAVLDAACEMLMKHQATWNRHRTRVKELADLFAGLP